MGIYVAQGSYHSVAVFFCFPSIQYTQMHKKEETIPHSHVFAHSAQHSTSIYYMLVERFENDTTVMGRIILWLLI